MQLIRLAAIAAVMAPIPATAAVMLQVPQVTTAPACYSDSPACDRSVTAPLRTAAQPSMMPEPAVAAIVGIAILGLALGRRRPGLPQVVS